MGSRALAGCVPTLPYQLPILTDGLESGNDAIKRAGLFHAFKVPTFTPLARSC
jgi:hypothetical protein